MKLNTYQKVAISTIAATIFLIFVGGLVRVSGSGLGCPDWPKCFGSWMPPAAASDLPARFDASQFNVYKTWTEYLNRVVGVAIGLLITATFILSFRYRKKEPAVFYSSFAAFALVVFQGWLGGQVVQTGLRQWLISIHMIVAMAIMTILIYAVFRATREKWGVHVSEGSRRWLVGLALVLFICTLVQLVLGTQVREAINHISRGLPRSDWINATGRITEVHRSFAWTVFFSGAGLIYVSTWKTTSRRLRNMSIGLMGVIIIQIVLGVGLYYFGVPPVFQLLHLVVAAVLICVDFLFLLAVRKKQTTNDQGYSVQFNSKNF